MGGCYGCGTPWRSGWLYCRHCGLDREQALIGAVSASGAGVSKGIGSEGIELPIEEKISCPNCGGPIKPYSRYCELCGGSVDPATGIPEKSPHPERPFQDNIPEEVASAGVGQRFEKAPGGRWSRRTKDAGGEGEKEAALRSVNRKDREGVAKRARPVDDPSRQEQAIWWRAGVLVVGIVLLGLLGWWYWQGTETTGGKVSEGLGRSIPEGMVLVP